MVHFSSRVVLAAGVAGLFTLGAAAAALQAKGFAPGVGTDGSISVPDVDYRMDWAYLGSFNITAEDADGVAESHVVYTQPETVAHYRETGEYPDGAVLVKELYETSTDDLTTGRVSWNQDIKGWFVMVKDTQGRFQGNGLWGDGWGWAFFNPDAPGEAVTTDYKAECLACHEPARDTDLSYVQAYPSLRGPGR